MCCMTNISNMFLFNTGAWKLVSGSFMILFFLFSLIHPFEKKEHWNLDISGY